jgi:L-glyceraldehyde 3-phosphate reductase
MHTASSNRYNQITYRRCGQSGIRLPLISLGFWHNFGSVDNFANAQKMAHTAFDLGITHFDLANNYGPEPGSAERTLSQILKNGLGKYRDELIISSKAGYLMWPGPYGEWGSRKSLLASCDQSLKRLGLDYVDVFYHHRPDPDTPLEESMTALADIVRSGKALYAGISNYPVDRARQAFAILRELKTPCLLHQINFSMLNRHYEEEGMFELLDAEGVGGILFSPLAQGLLSDKYLHGIPTDSRAKRNHFLKEARITPELLAKIGRLNQLAEARGQTLAQMAIAWVLRFKAVTSALIGASRPEQISELVKGVQNNTFTAEERAAIEQILKA